MIVRFSQKATASRHKLNGEHIKGFGVVIGAGMDTSAVVIFIWPFIPARVGVDPQSGRVKVGSAIPDEAQTSQHLPNESARNKKPNYVTKSNRNPKRTGHNIRKDYRWLNSVLNQSMNQSTYPP